MIFVSRHIRAVRWLIAYYKIRISLDRDLVSSLKSLGRKSFSSRSGRAWRSKSAIQQIPKRDTYNLSVPKKWNKNDFLCGHFVPHGSFVKTLLANCRFKVKKYESSLFQIRLIVWNRSLEQEVLGWISYFNAHPLPFAIFDVFDLVVIRNGITRVILIVRSNSSRMRVKGHRRRQDTDTEQGGEEGGTDLSLSALCFSLFLSLSQPRPRHLFTRTIVASFSVVYLR